MESSEGTALKVKHEPTEPSSAVARIRKLERRNKSLIVGIFGGVGVVVVAVVLLAVFLKANDCEETKKQPEADEVKKPEDLKIGLLFASKGVCSSRERSLREASLLAIQDITGSKTPFGVIYFQEDTESSPEKALSSFKKLYYENRVKFFVGLSNFEAVEVAAWAAEHANDTLILTPHATTAELTKYSNVVQLSMTNQALAYALHSQLTDTKVVEIIPIVEDDVHSVEIVEELRSITESHMHNLQVISSIKYSPTNLEKKADEVLTEVKEVLKSHPNASILLVGGQNDARLILEAAHDDAVLLSRMWYASDEIALNHALLNSSRALNTSRIVGLYSLVFGGDQFGRCQKRGKVFAKLSQLLDEPPSLQAAMAYDAIQILYDTARAIDTVNPNQIKRELKSKEHWGSGVSGQILIDANGQRTSGDYLRVAVLPEIPDESKLQIVMESKWYIAGTIRVTKTDFMSKYGKRSASDDVMSQVLAMSSSLSLGMASGEVVNKSELLDLQSYLNGSCEDARIRVETIDPFSFRKVVREYSQDTFPNMMILPTVYGYEMRMSCQVPTGELTYETGCAPSDNPQEKRPCVTVLTKPKGRRKLLLSTASKNAITMCAASTVACGVCSGILAVLTFGLGVVGTCLMPCGYGVVTTCTSAGVVAAVDESGTVICTELLEQGHLPLQLFLQDVSFGKRLGTENPRVFKGYHLLAKPIVWLMRRSELVTNVVKIFALPWAEEMSYLEGVGTSSSTLGGLVMSVGMPLCTAVGYLVEAWETVVANMPWAGMSCLGGLMAIGVPFYRFKNTF